MNLFDPRFYIWLSIGGARVSTLGWSRRYELPVKVYEAAWQRLPPAGGLTA